MAQNYAMVIFNSDKDLDQLLTKEANDKLETKQLKAVSINNHADKTIFVTKVRPFVAGYSTEELKTNINLNNKVKVTQLYIVKRKDYVQGQPISLKLTLSTIQETREVLSGGIQVLKMDIPPGENLHGRSNLNCTVLQMLPVWALYKQLQP